VRGELSWDWLEAADEYVNSDGSLGGRVTDVLKHGIMQGSIGPGTRLVERQVAEALGASRSPVREALHRLAQEGFIEAWSSGGYFVSFLTNDKVQESFKIRSALEGLIGEILATRPTEEYVVELEDCLDEMEQADQRGDLIGAVRADMRFHSTAARHSGSERLVSMLDSLRGPVASVMRLSVASTDARLRAEDHRFLVRVVRQGDPRIARVAFEEHVLQAGEVALRALQSGA